MGGIGQKEKARKCASVPSRTPEVGHFFSFFNLFRLSRAVGASTCSCRILPRPVLFFVRRLRQRERERERERVRERQRTAQYTRRVKEGGEREKDWCEKVFVHVLYKKGSFLQFPLALSSHTHREPPTIGFNVVPRAPPAGHAIFLRFAPSRAAPFLLLAPPREAAARWWSSARGCRAPTESADQQVQQGGDSGGATHPPEQLRVHLRRGRRHVPLVCSQSGPTAAAARPIRPGERRGKKRARHVTSGGGEGGRRRVVDRNDVVSGR